ncbi:thermonuclease family protein [Bacillus marinisedimentorum]|uniref:thermonuclease family protein n=1 Tax=Bacillus marinisedimentorum TaxID=1821260 RepID=UPI000871BB31|nr:thermonuclease family protein [Bacillus marinisedimentorum]
MRKRKRTTGANLAANVLLSVFLVMLLAACGDSSATDGAADKNTGAATKAKTEKSAPTAEDLEEDFGHIENPASEIVKITEEVKVVHVIDGDTIVVEGENGEETVNLLLVDAPELVLPDGSEDGMYGFESNKYTTLRLEDSPALLERGDPEKDKDGHTLGYIWMENNADHYNFNKLMLQDGIARLADESAETDKYLDEFREAEAKAKQEQRHIWSIDGYVTEDGFDSSLVQ